MNSKRSMWKVLLGVVGMGLLVTNCTIKTTDDDDIGCTEGTKNPGCICSGDNSVSYQLCNAEGTWDACYCTGSSAGGASSSGGSSSGAGTSNSSAGKGGASTTGGASSSAAGEGGEAGEGPTVFATCGDCLDARCAAEYNACFDDPNCISANVDGSGQYERIAECINTERVNGLVKRDVVRGCGVTMGASADPDYGLWAPEGMSPATTNLLNCMADAPGAAPASWANDDANYPVDANDMINPTPWPAGSCAKDACTSAL
jgi:hypothetical protein